jgi:hypothetical protein
MATAGAFRLPGSRTGMDISTSIPPTPGRTPGLPSARGGGVRQKNCEPLVFAPALAIERLGPVAERLVNYPD